MVERVNGTHEEVRRLVSGLRRRGFREQAEKVEEVMAGIHEACEEARKRVWPKNVIEGAGGEAGTYDVDGQGRPSGADGVLYDSQVDAQGASKPPPEIKVWKSGL